MAKPPAVEQTYFYRAPPAKVFAALTDPEALTTWFVETAKVELRAGGAFRLAWPGGFTMRGRVTKFETDRSLVVAWVDQFDGKTVETEARFTVAKHGRGALLTVRHRGFKKGGAGIALYGGVRSGWAYYLLNLRSVLEHGIDLRTKQDAI